MAWTQEQLTEAKEALLASLKEEGLEAVSVLEPEPGELAALAEAEGTTPDQIKDEDRVRSIVVVLLPYYTGSFDGNLSMYCRCMDYHALVPKYLSTAGEAAQRVLGETLKWKANADTGPLHDRYLVLRSGLGVVGKNHMMISPIYGSFFFIAYLTLNAPLAPDPLPETERDKQGRPMFPSVGCLDCGRCLKACPGGALQKDGSFLVERCLSAITQKKGELTKEEKEIFDRGSMIFGCDVCQTVCPYNQNIPITPIREFREERIDSLTMKDLEGLSRKQFLEKYPHRAFTWRGPAVLRRNLQLLEERKR